jgi:hypothetical protein
MCATNLLERDQGVTISGIRVEDEPVHEHTHGGHADVHTDD